MDFSHHLISQEDTIVALATAAGQGGVAIVRLSGSLAFNVAEKLLKASPMRRSSHHAYYTYVIEEEEIIDDVLVLPMKAPRTYTGQDVVEIHCHGGYVIPDKVISLCLQHGARAADPGEFTKRAFLNDKIDLAQAEAVQRIICAKNASSMKIAREHLDGRLSKKVKQLQKDLSHIAAIIEAWVDYPEEGLEFASEEEILHSCSAIIEEIKHLLATFNDGQMLSRGIRLALLGSPNVGKSSLLNALLGKDRAIVTNIAGTTRDLLEEDIQINDLHYRIVDTAGIRKANEVIEEEGIKRSKMQAEHADIILFIFDLDKGLQEEEMAFLSSLPPSRTLAVGNKCDLTDTFDAAIGSPIVKISAKTHQGIEQLKHSIYRLTKQNHNIEHRNIVITEKRHYNALSQSQKCIEKFKEGMQQNISAEFLSIELKEALKHLSLIIGTDITEDILSSIFANFCVGK